MIDKKTILVTTSTFPRWEGDSTPAFVYELSKKLANDLNIIICAPHSRGAKKYEEKDNMQIHRYQYFFKDFQKICDGPILPNLKKNPFLFYQIPLLLIFQFFAIRKLIKNQKVDKIHAYWIIPQGFVAGLIKKVYGTPYIITSLGGDIFGAKNWFFRQFKKFALRNADAITALSNAIKDEIHRIANPKPEVNIIPLGVDPSLFTPKKYDNTIRKRYNIDGPFLLFVGRLTEKKGVKYLIQAIPSIIEKEPRAKLLLVGDGEEREYLEKLTKELKVEDNVVFCGWVNNKDLPVYYATADIFIGPSIVANSGDTEGLGLVFVEAMTCGTLTIASDVPAIRDVVIDNKTGHIVKQRSSKEIARKIIEVLQNKKSYNKISEEGRRYAIRKFSWEIIISEYKKVLEK